MDDEQILWHLCGVALEHSLPGNTRGKRHAARTLLPFRQPSVIISKKRARR